MIKVARIKGRYDITYSETGSGPTVLLIHGLAGDHKAWTQAIAELSSRFHVIAPDNRGAGKSSQVDEPISIKDMASDMLELMDVAGAPTFHVVGRSMGGCIAQEMAFAAPGRVKSIAMMASCAKCDPTQLRAMTNMREALELTGSWEFHANHSVLNFVSHTFFNNNPERMAQIVSIIASETRLQACYSWQNRAVQAHDVLDRLHTITCPVLIAHGGRDPLGSPTGTQWMIDRLPQAKVEFFAESSHFFFMEEPERFSRMLNGWLDEQALVAKAA